MNKLFNFSEVVFYVLNNLFTRVAAHKMFLVSVAINQKFQLQFSVFFIII